MWKVWKIYKLQGQITWENSDEKCKHFRVLFLYEHINMWGDFQICIRAPLIDSMILTIFAQIWGVPSVPLLLPLHYIYKRKTLKQCNVKFWNYDRSH